MYIKVSRQQSGIATAASGTGPQKVVDDALDNYFSKNDSINRVSTSRIMGIGNDPEGQQFDTVYQVDRKGKSAILDKDRRFLYPKIKSYFPGTIASYPILFIHLIIVFPLSTIPMGFP